MTLTLLGEKLPTIVVDLTDIRPVNIMPAESKQQKLTAFSSMMHLSQPVAWESGLHPGLGCLGLSKVALQLGGSAQCHQKKKTHAGY